MYLVTRRHMPEESNLHFNRPNDPDFHNPGLDHCWEEEVLYDSVVTGRCE
jgi:hypothetical protein